MAPPPLLLGASAVPLSRFGYDARRNTAKILLQTPPDLNSVSNDAVIASGTTLVIGKLSPDSRGIYAIVCPNAQVMQTFVILNTQLAASTLAIIGAWDTDDFCLRVNSNGSAVNNTLECQINNGLSIPVGGLKITRLA